jgi:EAL domain-containing protein (putative c-di-GMP-specific phosphodiesterase class I)
VNVSTKQFAQPDLVARIRRALDESRLDPRDLKLEITEGTIMNHPESAAVMLEELRALGVQISIDDFGTGYSSLSYLQRFAVDTVKIDQSFVRGMALSENLEIIRAIVNLAHTLELDVVAEGIETEDQCRRLGTLACEYGQGFLYSRPLDAEAVAGLFATDPSIAGSRDRLRECPVASNGSGTPAFFRDTA